MVYWFNGFPYVFRNNPHVSKHKTSHLQPILYTGICNMMFVTHTVIKESAGNAGGDTPLPIYRAGGYPSPCILWHLIIMFVKSHNYNSFYVMEIHIHIYIYICVCVCICKEHECPLYTRIEFYFLNTSTTF